MKYIFKTKDFLEIYANREIKKFFGKDAKKLSSGLLEYEGEIKKEDFYNFFYFSRCFESVFIDDFDLIGLNMFEREFKLNLGENSIDSSLAVYLYYVLDLDKIKEFKIIDPSAFLGDIILEIIGFNRAYFVKKRNNLPFNSYFKVDPILPKINSKNLILASAVVSDNLEFKKLRENLSYLGEKLRLSKYDFSWLDVKFKGASFDYGVSFIPFFDSNDEMEAYLKDFFYMMTFICEKKIGLISKVLISSRFMKKNKLKLEFENKINLEGEDFYIYIFKI